MKHDSTIPSENLAVLIVDALADAGLVSRTNVDEAIKVAALEISVRKALGDYFCPACEIGPEKFPYQP